MSERSIFGFKSAFRLEWRRQNGQDETQQFNHCPSIGDSVASSTRDKVFGTHRQQVADLPEAHRNDQRSTGQAHQTCLSLASAETEISTPILAC
jgi:hypothetical protein